MYDNGTIYPSKQCAYYFYLGLALSLQAMTIINISNIYENWLDVRDSAVFVEANRHDYTVKIQEQLMPKKSNDSQYQTPIKKWKKMSPFQEDLAIIESDDSNSHQHELFTSLVDHTFSLQVQESSLGMQEFEEQESDPFFFSVSEFNSQLPQDIVHDHKINLPLTSQKPPLQQIDTNRRGCKCQKSKCNKKYCDCLRYGLTCADGICSCENCDNREEKQIHRQISKKLSKLQEQIYKGCHCKKSKCHKKYCECHSGGKKCGKLCECVDCQNMDEQDITKYDRARKMIKRQCLIE